MSIYPHFNLAVVFCYYRLYYYFRFGTDEKHWLCLMELLTVLPEEVSTLKWLFAQSAVLVYCSFTVQFKTVVLNMSAGVTQKLELVN